MIKILYSEGSDNSVTIDLTLDMSNGGSYY